MTTEETPAETAETPRVNVADRLALHAAQDPDATAVVTHDGRNRTDAAHARRTVRPGCNATYSSASFGYLDHEATRLARGLVAMGVRPGRRIALLVKPGIEFVALVFALLRSGATMVLVDGGLGRKNIVRCLESTNPDGFVAIPQGHALRVLMRKKFPQAKLNVTVGRRWFWGGQTLSSLRRLGGAAPQLPTPNSQLPTANPQLPTTHADDPAAIVFTSGSTGPPKGVVYRHETFATQCDEIQRRYDLRPGAVDLACFPLFGLFNVACGVTTIFPEMDFSRPASCDPKKLFAAANQWRCTQSFASPAVWDRLSRHAEETGEGIPTLKKVFSCGAPVPAKVIRRTLKMIHPEAELHTPYGATEALPVATIEAKEILDETAAKTDGGAGVCVGRAFGPKAEGGRGKGESFEWRVIKITDDPIATIDGAEELPVGEIGELIVRGPQVSQAYLTTEPRPSGSVHNRLAKIADDPRSGNPVVWHRMGDVGYLDDQQRFWYCGRKSQRVVTSERTWYTETVEQVFNSECRARMSALVSAEANGKRNAILIADEQVPPPVHGSWRDQLYWLEDQHALFENIHSILVYPGPLPTDIRHNSKIRREELAVWAAKELKKQKEH